MKKVSVIMSAFNAGKYIDEAICSILNQTYNNIEFIIIDDGSTDDTLGIIKSFDDARIVLLSRENKGLTKSLNEAINLATGDYICRQDADDISCKTRIEKQVDFLECNNADAVFCQSDDGINILPKWYMTKRKLNINNLSFGNVITHGTLLCRSEVLMNNSYNEKWVVGQDYELWLRLLSLKYKLMLLREPLYYLTRHENSISAKKSELQEKLATEAVIEHGLDVNNFIKKSDCSKVKLLKKLKKVVTLYA
ncbi:glycosyl transferase family 2 [Vibrio splendidus]|uniref:glycosyltransferase family 2 protein n=1 Tax=Vibrio splendidus TaxID=29497 RepID=UPI000D367900|nr:glycosyltransferase [Vibrio splendidus]PTP86659.1 glycosyl transferase family 2 [Vibrio splendidus]